MHRSSETIGAIAAALAKAQAGLENPEKTLTATIPGGERSFRYASLAGGLDLVRKSLSQHEIAVIQTTALEQGQIMLTTLLVHASGEWVSSLWPVCPAAESSAQVKGTALTYARRYALFTLVGIAGEDDLDAPDLARKAESQPPPEQSRPRIPNKESIHFPRRPPLDQERSTQLRERLLQEMSCTDGDEALALWAFRSLPLKNILTAADAGLVEKAYLAKIADGSQEHSTFGDSAPDQRLPEDSSPAANGFAPLTKPVLKRSKAHLTFVASHPCLVCHASPCDAHHLKIARPRSLGRKVSDEFTVPLCREHHQELHRQGNEANWWTNMQVTPLPVAKELWESSPVHGAPNSMRELPQSDRATALAIAKEAAN